MANVTKIFSVSKKHREDFDTVIHLLEMKKHDTLKKTLEYDGKGEQFIESIHWILPTKEFIAQFWIWLDQVEIKLSA